jgi:hypothetical protein
MLSSNYYTRLFKDHYDPIETKISEFFDWLFIPPPKSTNAQYFEFVSTIAKYSIVISESRRVAVELINPIGHQTCDDGQAELNPG